MFDRAGAKLGRVGYTLDTDSLDAPTSVFLNALSLRKCRLLKRLPQERPT